MLLVSLLFTISCAQNEQFYFINEEQALTGPYDEIWEFSEGLAVVRLGEKYAYVDKAGRLQIPARYSGAASFQEGLLCRDRDWVISINKVSG
jgi:hypothetical protein